jgi:hypothetical protein
MHKHHHNDDFKPTNRNLTYILYDHDDPFGSNGDWDWLFETTNMTRIRLFNNASNSYERDFKDGSHAFNNGNWMVRTGESPQPRMRANFTVKYPVDQKVDHIQSVFCPDAVNTTYAHEMTHDTCHRYVKNNPLEDDDGDGVPNGWEISMEMDPKSRLSYGSFTGSRGGDQELYAWLSTCFTHGFVEIEKTDRTTKNTEQLRKEYKGVIPPRADLKSDWSVGGYNWFMVKEDK